MTQYVRASQTTEPESLAQFITIRAPYQTPFIQQMPHVTIPRVMDEYGIDDPFTSTDNVRSVSNPHVDTKTEGADYSYSTPSYPTRLRCIAEIKHHGIEMSGTARAGRLSHTDRPWDYEVARRVTAHLNSIDNTCLYGTGSTVTDGSAVTGTDMRMTQGCLYWAAWTGLERAHGGGTKTQIQDPYGITIPARNFSNFYDFAHNPITLDSFYLYVIVPLKNAGADFTTAPWSFWCGGVLQQRIARFMIADGGVPINWRERSADDNMGNDMLNTFRLASGDIVTFRDNRWLNETGSTWTLNNAAGTPTSPTSEGTQSRTFYADQTLFGWEPGMVQLAWYRQPGFDMPARAGDYSRLAVVSEFAVKVLHPCGVGGAGNCLS